MTDISNFLNLFMCLISFKVFKLIFMLDCFFGGKDKKIKTELMHSARTKLYECIKTHHFSRFCFHF